MHLSLARLRRASVSLSPNPDAVVRPRHLRCGVRCHGCGVVTRFRRLGSDVVARPRSFGCVVVVRPKRMDLIWWSGQCNLSLICLSDPSNINLVLLPYLKDSMIIQV